MTHEIKNIIQGFLNARHLGLRCVIATVVDLDGSSYRRPGVRMLINEHGHMTGAVSGGCVEKEILKQSGSVFESGVPKMMSYDGRYRLGCEGTLYILIELFEPGAEVIETFERQIRKRKPFELISFFSKTHGVSEHWGTQFVFEEDKAFPLSETSKLQQTTPKNCKVFRQSLQPCFKLVIIGAEHDAAQLSIMASLLGWETSVVVSPSNPQSLKDFPGAVDLIRSNGDQLDLSLIDKETAVILMTHSYVRDLEFLFALRETRPAYIGLLGPSNRRERMLNDLIEKYPSMDESIFDLVFGPAGLNIGAETPQEIALSICSEILALIRDQEPKSLKDKVGSIHLKI